MNAIASTAALPLILADRAALLAAAERAVLVTERRTTYPILANVRLQSDGRTLFMSATDLDTVLDIAVPADAPAGFDMTLPAFMLRDLLKGAPKASDAVTISAPPVIVKQVPTGEYELGEDGQRVTYADGSYIPVMRDAFDFDGPAVVDFGKVTYKLNGLPSQNWPQLIGPRQEWRNEAGLLLRSKAYRSFTMSGADLFAALDSVRFAMSSEETRYYLRGVYMHVAESGAGSELRFVATDGHRMARQDMDVPEGAAGMPGSILPTHLVNLLLKLLKPAKGKVSPAVLVEVDDSKVRFMFDDVTVTGKTVEGSFPDYERVTPKQNDKFATFNVAALLEAVKAVSMIASERGGKAVKLAMEAGRCTVSVSNPDNGSAESSFEIGQAFTGSLEIGFNAKYLAEIVTEAGAGGNAVTLAFSDGGSPTVIRGARERWLSVLMPMRV